MKYCESDEQFYVPVQSKYILNRDPLATINIMANRQSYLLPVSEKVGLSQNLTINKCSEIRDYP
jgi:hypothetical protein